MPEEGELLLVVPQECKQKYVMSHSLNKHKAKKNAKRCKPPQTLFLLKNLMRTEQFNVFLHPYGNFSIRNKTKEFSKRYFIKHNGRENSRNQ